MTWLVVRFHRFNQLTTFHLQAHMTHTFYVVRTTERHWLHEGYFNQFYDYDAGFYLKKTRGFSASISDAEIYGSHTQAQKAISLRVETKSKEHRTHFQIVPVEVRELA